MPFLADFRLAVDEDAGALEVSSEWREDGLEHDSGQPFIILVSPTGWTYPGCDIAGRFREPRRGPAAEAGAEVEAAAGAVVRGLLGLLGGGDGGGCCCPGSSWGLSRRTAALRFRDEGGPAAGVAEGAPAVADEVSAACLAAERVLLEVMSRCPGNGRVAE